MSHDDDEYYGDPLQDSDEREIVRDLAKRPVPCRMIDVYGYECALCNRDVEGAHDTDTAKHAPHCPWRRAKELNP